MHVPGARTGREELVVWHSERDACAEQGRVYRWEGYAEQGEVRSLLRYVDEHRVRLRRAYIGWVHDLGESRPQGGARLVDLLSRSDGFSYWWMTTFAEQSLMKSPAILDAIRLLALEEIVVSEGVGALRLVSPDGALDEVLRGMCAARGITYRWDRQPADGNPGASDEAPGWMRRHIRSLPHPVRGFLALASHVAARWPMRRARMRHPEAPAGTDAVCFVSYLFHVDAAAGAEGRFRSHYWGELPAVLMAAGRQVNWLHLYVPSRAVPTPRTAADWVARFNTRRDREGTHSLLDSYLTPRLVLRAFREWLRLLRSSRRLLGAGEAFRPRDSQLSLWPVMRRDWEDSLRGATASINVLVLELMDAAMGAMPRQQRGVYLCENQGWERAMIHAWRKHGHGELIAFAHSTTRFWDLRYFSDPRLLQEGDVGAMPRADVLALNGRAELDACAEAGIDGSWVAECESLRYMYLGTQRNQPREGAGQRLRLLVLGDQSASETLRALDLLERALPGSGQEASISFKPHPLHAFDDTRYASLAMDVVHAPLAELIARHDVAYTTNATSAAVDAYLSGLPVLIVLDERQPNLSPLRGYPDARFVSTAGELAGALSSWRDVPPHARPRDFFFLDPALPRWKRLLGVPA